MFSSHKSAGLEIETCNNRREEKINLDLNANNNDTMLTPPRELSDSAEAGRVHAINLSAQAYNFTFHKMSI